MAGTKSRLRGKNKAPKGEKKEKEQTSELIGVLDIGNREAIANAITASKMRIAKDEVPILAAAIAQSAGLMMKHWPELKALREDSEVGAGMIKFAMITAVDTRAATPVIKQQISFTRPYKDKAETILPDPNQPELPVATNPDEQQTGNGERVVDGEETTVG